MLPCVLAFFERAESVATLQPSENAERISAMVWCCAVYGEVRAASESAWRLPYASIMPSAPAADGPKAREPLAAFIAD